MLELKQIKKDYQAGDTNVHALKGISLNFRKNEFVSILGQSGCGKTTLLNIIGGLDRYTTGDLVINHVSTKEYQDNDWDIYRNNSIGFVFQSYNLITHQSVLTNVELALTLSGVSVEERKQRAKDVLTKVGLKDHIHKKPNQLSGGQMQRVAIARALVNNPDIILADEPTGALDTATSVQIMEILKEISKDKLIIMVTHNPELAEKYSSRIVKLSDGEVVSDSHPHESTPDQQIQKPKNQKKISMNFLTALSLSRNNLLTKKGRTFLTAFAGSIGIIGIALILALSNGIQNYINKVEEDTLSSYPITIEDTSMDMSAMIGNLMQANKEDNTAKESGKIYSKEIMSDLLSTMSTRMQKNNLEEFKKYLESENNTAKDSINALQYSYDLNLNLYRKLEQKEEYLQVNPTQVMNSIGMGQMMEARENSSVSSMMPMSNLSSTTEIWKELLDNPDLLKSQYDLLAGHFPENYNEVVLVVNKDNTVSDYTLYALGLRDQEELAEKFSSLLTGESIEVLESVSYTYDYLLDLEFKLLLNTDYYVKENNLWMDKRNNTEYMNTLLEEAENIKLVGILRLNEESVSTSMSSGLIGYTKELKEYVINQVNNSEIAKEQTENPEMNLLTGMNFLAENTTNNGFDYSLLSEEQKAYLSSLSEEEQVNLLATYSTNLNNTYESNLKTLGIVDLNKPNSIQIYPVNFDGKNKIADAIDEYNQNKENEGKEDDVIHYSDLVGMMMSSVTSIINMISYVLIAFVAISLVVSSIMIGIITYISVLERTKEIGILRSIGASKQDISRVFNAETFIVGLVAGLIGIGITVLLSIPTNIIIKNITNVSNVAKLPIAGAIILILISMLLTMFAGLLPAKMASKKDPVIALRTD
ncbi:ABC transporter [Clostridia bacterium]|nr:ABC transporter [Clostridia bacterium]